jgi:hypothetical protein
MLWELDASKDAMEPRQQASLASSADPPANLPASVHQATRSAHNLERVSTYHQRYAGQSRVRACACRRSRYSGYDALKNPSHVVRLHEQSKDPKRSPESPHPMSEENQNRNRP